MTWIIFGNSNWVNAGNSAEQYARTISQSEKCYFVHGAKSKLETHYGNLKIIPRTQNFVEPCLQENTNGIAMFCFPSKLNLQYLRHGKTRNIKTVYRCVDDWATYDWEGHRIEYNEEVEREMMKLSSVSVASCKEMAKKFFIPYLPNGCSSSLYPTTSKRKEANEMTVGFWGNVNLTRFDKDLILHAARKFPRVQFKLIGSIENWPDKPNNIIMKPFMTWKESMQEMEEVHVGLIPYQGKVKVMQPIKTWEYLALGIPQLCKRGLDLPEHDSILLYDDKEEFCHKLQYLIKECDNIDTERLKAFAKINTWLDTTNQIMRWLNEDEKTTDDYTKTQ